MFQTDSLHSFPNLSALCQKDEKQRKSLEKLLKQKPNVVKSLDIYAQNIEEYLKDQRRRIAYLKKKEQQPQYETKPQQIYDEAIIQQFNRVRAKQYYLQQSQKRSSQQPSPEQNRNRTPSKYFDKNYTPLKRIEKFDIPSLQPVSQSPPKELKPIQFKFNYYVQNNDPIVKQVFSNRAQWFEVPNNQFAHFQWLTQLLDFSSFVKQDVLSKRQMINLMEFHNEWSSKSGLYNTLSQISSEYALKILQPGFVINFKIAQWVDDLELIQEYFLQNHPQKKSFRKFQLQVYLPAKTGISYNQQMIQQLKECPNLWICKPVQCSGATLINSLEQIQQILNQYYKESKEFIIQKYIINPLLFNGKKFDIQVNVLVNQDNQIFISSEPTARCCLQNYDINSDDPNIHTESKQQISNKDLIDFLNTQGINNQQLQTQMIKIIQQIPCKLNRRQRKYCMQIFGFDFLMDDTKNLNLIGINSNPIITANELEGAFKHTIDKIFPINIKNENQLWVQI